MKPQGGSDNNHLQGGQEKRSSSRSPARPVQGEWKNPGDLDDDTRRESEMDQSEPGPERRQSDDAYSKIKEASMKKDTRRSSAPATPARYPPPPKLETYPTQPRSFLWLAMLTAIFNILFGIVALVCAITSDNAWAAGDREGAKKRGRYALIACILGIICTLIIIIAVPVSYRYIYPS